MPKTAIFTIVTKSYIGLANVMLQSITDNGKLNDAELFVFLADELEDREEVSTVANRLVDCKKEVINNDSIWNGCAFKYNVTEFCTFLKPYSFEYLYQQGFTNVIYFDPDIYVFNDLNPLISNLQNQAVVLTPHVTNTESCSKNPVFSESSFAINGIFNLGFIAANDTLPAKNLINWWAKMVLDKGYLDYAEGLATDQKWMDFAPAFLGTDLLIERGFGYNAGFWNIQEREISVDGNLISVNERDNANATKSPLYFFHFSALYYPDIYNFGRSKYGVDFLKVFPDLEIILSRYKISLGENFSLHSSLKYSYSLYDNMKPISHLNRRLYRRLIENDTSLTEMINPFESKGPFYRTLEAHKLIEPGTGSTVTSSKEIVSGSSVKGRKNSKVYVVLRLISKWFGLKAVNRIISAGKSMGKEEAHMEWLQKDFYEKLGK